jgi:hypothetical protein
VSTIVDDVLGLGEDKICIVQKSTALYSQAVPFRTYMPAGGYVGKGTWREVYDASRKFRPLFPGEQIQIRQVPYGFGMDITPTWTLTTVRTYPYQNENRFTISIPGFTDIVRTPWTESYELKRERRMRWEASKTALPQGLQPWARLLNKLDDAQDLLFTGLALAWPIFKYVLPRSFMGPLGFLLTINDFFNAAS